MDLAFTPGLSCLFMKGHVLLAGIIVRLCKDEHGVGVWVSFWCFVTRERSQNIL